MTIDTHEKRCERARKLFLRFRKENSCKVRIFLDEKLFVTDALINHCNSRYLTGLLVSDDNKDIQISPCFKALAKVMALRSVASDGKRKGHR
jgi:hypothetical protein